MRLPSPDAARGLSGSAPEPWRERDTLIVLLTTLLLAVVVWVRSDGYVLADSVEYIEHAQALVAGERVVDSSDIRGIGFAIVLAPPFLVAQALGIEDLRWVVPFARLLQLVFTLLLVRAAMRIGNTVAGRRAGLAAGWIAGTSPVLLTFSIEPVADVLAATLGAEALLRALQPTSTRRNLAVGLWLGAALLIAFKSLLVAGPLAALVALRDARRPRAVGALLLGLGIGVLVQMLLDRLRYGEWGRSLEFYLGANAYPIGARIAGELGFVDLARRLYEMSEALHTGQPHSAADAVMGDVRQRASVDFYFVHAARFVALPALVLVLVGAARAVLRPRFVRLVPLALVVIAAVVTTYKGSKDLRLWLPLLPAVAALGALGFGAIAGELGARRWRLAAATGLVLATAVLSAVRIAEGGSKRHAGYWRAMEGIVADAEERGRPLRVSAAWHWAVFLRESPDVELVKLPHHVEAWNAYGDAERARDLEVFDGLDRFITHLAVLTERPTLFAALNERFAVEAFWFDPVHARDLGPILVLARRDAGIAAADRAVLLDISSSEDPETYAARHGLGAPVDLVLTPADGSPQRLRWLGFDVRELDGGHHWLTLHWMAVTGVDEELLVLERIETVPSGAVHENVGPLAWGLAPVTTWAPGTIVREGRPLVAAAKPFDAALPWRPLGAETAEGGAMLDAQLLIAVFAPPRGERTAPLVLTPAPAGADEPFTPERLDPQGRLRAGAFPLPRIAGE